MLNRTYRVFEEVDNHLSNIILEQEKLHEAFKEFRGEKEKMASSKYIPIDNVGVYTMGYYNDNGSYTEVETADIKLYNSYYARFSDPDYKIPNKSEYYKWLVSDINRQIVTD